MGRLTRALGPMFTITASIAVWLIVMVTVSASPRQNAPAGVAIAPASAPAPSAQAAAPTGGYVGEDTCLTCHEEMKKGYHDSKHARTHDARTPAANKGCESCHGPGQAHVEADGDKTKIRRIAT